MQRLPFELLPGDGAYRLEVRSLDALGNVGAGKIGPGYLLDATPPARPAVTGSHRHEQRDRRRLDLQRRRGGDLHAAARRPVVEA